MTETIKADDVIDFSLRSCLQKLGEQLDGEVIAVKSPIYQRLDDAIREKIERLARTKGKNIKTRLIVVLETNGGHIEVVERICNVFRRYFKEVDFVIPNHAYSAGTVLALSGDNIYMDYYSILGPIDPQIEDDKGRFVPGMGYLYKYGELIEKSRKGNITDAELLFLTKRFDPAELFVIEQSKNHSVELLKEWLVKYKFKNWKTTKTHNAKVTKKMKEDRAESIADTLGNAERWHSHGRGISIKELMSEEIKLQIEDFGKSKDLNQSVRQYYDLFIDYSGKLGAQSALHSEDGFTKLG